MQHHPSPLRRVSILRRRFRLRRRPRQLHEKLEELMRRCVQLLFPLPFVTWSSPRLFSGQYRPARLAIGSHQDFLIAETLKSDQLGSIDYGFQPIGRVRKKRPGSFEPGLKGVEYAYFCAVVRVQMAGVPPLTHDRALTITARGTIPVNTLADCSFLYISGNNTWRYFLHS